MFGPERARSSQLEDAGHACDRAHCEPTQGESCCQHAHRRDERQNRGERAGWLQDPSDPQHAQGGTAGERNQAQTKRRDGSRRQQEEQVDKGQGAGDDGKWLVRYADTLPKQRAAPSKSDESQQEEQEGGDGQYPADFRADRIRKPHLERVRNPGQEEGCPEREIDDGEDAQGFIALTRCPAGLLETQKKEAPPPRRL